MRLIADACLFHESKKSRNMTGVIYAVSEKIKHKICLTKTYKIPIKFPSHILKNFNNSHYRADRFFKRSSGNYTIIPLIISYICGIRFNNVYGINCNVFILIIVITVHK